MLDEQTLAEKVLLYLGDGPEHAIMTFAEDGSTFQQLIDLAKKVQDSQQQRLDISGVELIKNERERQVSEEGYTREHDDAHDDQCLARAAVCYAIPNRSAAQAVAFWPWTDAPVVNHNVHNPRGRESRVRELVIAGALLAAEIDRLRRVKVPGTSGSLNENSEPEHGRWWGAQFCPHPGQPCIDGCYFCGRPVGALSGDHNHTQVKVGGEVEYSCVCSTC